MIYDDSIDKGIVYWMRVNLEGNAYFSQAFLFSYLYLNLDALACKNNFLVSRGTCITIFNNSLIYKCSTLRLEERIPITKIFFREKKKMEMEKHFRIITIQGSWARKRSRKK